MSFQEQEKALYDLLFDENRRLQFCQDPEAALSQYELEETERDDFLSIRPEALKLDAAMRADLILSHLCKSFPLSFSIVSSFKNGIEVLKALINMETMQASSIQRTGVFAQQLKTQYSQFPFNSGQQSQFAVAILEAESGLCWTSASLKEAVIAGEKIPEPEGSLTDDWADQTIGLASYVCAGVLPQSYVSLKQSLCKSSKDGLWRQLNRSPLSANRRSKILAIEDPRLLVARAFVSQHSVCEPAIDHKTLELSEGFASLFQYVNGSMSVAQISSELKRIGAPDTLLKSIESGFKELLKNGMLVLR